MTVRPDRVVVVLGTGTEVGKTWVAARALSGLRARGVAVAARKPAQSAEPDDPAPSDADVLSAATGEDPLVVCPAHRRYRVAMAPPMAAAALGLEPPTIAALAAEVTWAPATQVGLVETAGGLLSPAATDGTGLDLARAMGCDLAVLVADAGLGALNGVRLTLAALADDPWPTLVVLNRHDPGDALHRANRTWLAERDRLDVVVDVAELVDRLTP